MKTMLFAIVLLALATATASAADRAPVVRYVDDKYGSILATPNKQALYTWSAERDFRVHCTGACAKAWPPLIVKSAAKRIPGIKGGFGTIRRPDGRRQLTFNRRPVYTYAHEGPKQVLCDNVNGWFVVRLR